MEKTMLKRAVALMIAAQIVAVACGDGGKKRRTPIHRTGVNGQKATPQGKSTPTPTTTPSATPPPSGGEKSTAQGGGDALPKEDDIKVKSQKMSQMKRELDQRMAGTSVSARELEEGIYTLELVVSHLSFQEGSEELTALNVRRNNNGNISTLEVSESVGLASNLMDNGRNVIVPNKFYVQGFNGQPWQPKRDQSVSELVFKTALEIKPGSLTLTDVFADGADVRQDGVSLIQSLTSVPGAIDGQTAYQVSDFDGKKVNLRLRKGSDGKLRMVVTVLESGDEAVSSDPKTSNRYMNRTLVFIYSREALPVDKSIPEEKKTELPTKDLPVSVET